MDRYFRYKGNKYQLVGVGKMKHPETREWVDAVMYKSSSLKNEERDKLYTREIEDFRSKFIEECGCGKFKKCSDNLNTCPIL